MPQRIERSFIELKVKCTSILGDTEVISLVKDSSSPTAAFDIVFAITNDLIKAKAARWLAVLRRDYPEKYNELMTNL